MGLIKGTSSFVVFSVTGELPENPLEFITARVNAFSFSDIDENYDEYSVGWVSVHNMFDASFAYASSLVGDYITLTLRVDERKVVPAILKKFTMKEEERVRQEKQVPKLSRAMRIDIRERVRQELLRKALPVPSTYDLCWNLSAASLLFFSTNKQAQAVLEDYFKECFGLLLQQQIPFTVAENFLTLAQRHDLDELRSELFI
jgi:DNA recombination-dependent growth factor C